LLVTLVVDVIFPSGTASVLAGGIEGMARQLLKKINRPSLENFLTFWKNLVIETKTIRKGTHHSIHKTFSGIDAIQANGFTHQIAITTETVQSLNLRKISVKNEKIFLEQKKNWGHHDKNQLVTPTGGKISILESLLEAAKV